MRFRKLLGTILKHGFFAVLLGMQVVSLYQDATLCSRMITQ